MAALEFLTPLVVAFGVATLATPLVRRVASAMGVLDRPSERAVNQRSDVPLLGGLAVALGFASAVALAMWLISDQLGDTRQLQGLAIGGTLMLVVGAWDDRWGLGAWPKFLLQFAAALIAISYGFRLGHLTDPVTRTTFLLPEWLIWVVTSLWIVGVTNAVNLIDGLDGLAAGVATIIAATLTAIYLQSGDVMGACLGVALVGSLLGFLPFNFWPARIFLGDTGALFIGYTLALLSLEGYRQLSLVTFIVPLLALAVPILDTGLSVLRRLRRGSNPFRADRLHMHHRLLRAEGSHQRAVLSLYFLTGCFCLIAFSFTRIEGPAVLLFLAFVVLFTVRLLRNLGVYADDPEQAKAPKVPAAVEEERR